MISQLFGIEGIEDKNSDASTSSNMQIYDRSTKLWNIFVDTFIFLFDEATCFLFYQKCIYTIYMYINSLWQFKMFPCLFTCKTLLLVHVPPCTHRFKFQKVVFDSSTHWTIGEWLTMATRNTHILNICTLSPTYLTFSWLF